MTEKRNLTVCLDEAIVSQAKIIAAKQGTSISRLLTKLVEELVERDRLYESSMSAALSYLETGFPLGGEKPVSREAWHDR